MKVFITRYLDNESIFKKKLIEKGLEVVGESLLEFSSLVPESIEQGDCYFFYSQQGFIFGKDYLSRGIPIATIGQPTAAFIRKNGWEVDFEGEGTNEQIAQLFLEKYAQKKVVFLMAKNSKHALEPFLKDKVELSKMIVYENKIKQDIQPIEADILVFTSSMNAESFVKNKLNFNHKTIIAIGQPTAQTLSQLGITVTKIAQNPSESSLADAVLTMF